MCKLSVIIPAYNVEEYIEKCITTIENQTFRDFEVICIDDGSTDLTGEILDSWASRDDRVKVIHKQNEGVFIARNDGIATACGEYLSFVDADDWVELDFFEEMINIADYTKSDVVECDFWRFNNKTGELTCKRTYGSIGVDYEPLEHMIYVPSMLWKCFFKREFWSNNKIEIPNCLGSAHVIYVLLFLLKAKWVNIRKPLYYYRRMRQGSIVDRNGDDTNEHSKMGLAELEVLRSELINRGLFNQFYDLFKKIVCSRLSDFLAAQYQRRTGDDYLKQVHEYRFYIKDLFDRDLDSYFVIGGYNLNRIAAHLPLLQDPMYRYNFSSIISMMSTKVEVEVNHKNAYRKKMVIKDIKASLSEDLRKERPDFILLDLMDERFDLIETSDGYITDSEAFKESECYLEKKRIIHWGSKEYKKLLYDAIDELIKLCDSLRIRVVIVENYLCEQHGNINTKVDYDSIECIKKINILLKDIYSYINEKYKNLIKIKTKDIETYFTDDEYEYGVFPWHINENANMIIADRIWEELNYIQ